MRCLAALLIAFASVAVADVPKWDIRRTTAPDSVEDMKSLQTAVKAMVEKTTPATVALFYGQGAGSGVIIREDGLILTAAHVVTNMAQAGFGNGGGRRGEKETNRVKIELFNGKTVNGLVLGRDSRTDSAMVKITDPIPKDAKWPGADKGKWPLAELGKSTELKKAQWVVSLGHPGGPKEGRRAPVRLGQLMSVTEKGRRISSDCTLVGGDSGGPLFDLDGKVIGIHSSIGNDLTQNFHVPLHSFQNDGRWARLLRGDNIGAPASGFLGIVLAGDEDKKDRNTSKPLIEEVRKGSPADNAGLQVGDLILEFKSEKVASSEDIDQMMEGSRPNDRLLVKVKRGDENYELEVTLGTKPKN